MSLGDLDMEKGDFEAAVNDTKEALKIRSELFPEVSRKIADCYFFLGISYFYMAQNNALLSEDDKSLEKVAEENAKESKTNLEKSRSIFGKLCVEKAVELKVLEAKEGRRLWNGTFRRDFASGQLHRLRFPITFPVDSYSLAFSAAQCVLANRLRRSLPVP